MEKEGFIPEGMEGLCEIYHHAPAMRAGNIVWTSGQVGMKDSGEIPETFVEQAHVAFQNLKRVLEAAGACLDDIVELQTFYSADSAGFLEVKDQYLTHNYPAWTGLGVRRCGPPGNMLEIKAVAVIGSGRRVLPAVQQV